LRAAVPVGVLGLLSVETAGYCLSENGLSSPAQVSKVDGLSARASTDPITDLVIERHGSEIIQLVQVDIPGTEEGPFARSQIWVRTQAGVSRCSGVPVPDGARHGLVPESEAAGGPAAAARRLQSAVPARVADGEPSLNVNFVVLAWVGVCHRDIAKGGSLNLDRRLGESVGGGDGRREVGYQGRFYREDSGTEEGGSAEGCWHAGLGEGKRGIHGDVQPW